MHSQPIQRTPSPPATGFTPSSYFDQPIPMSTSAYMLNRPRPSGRNSHSLFAQTLPAPPPGFPRLSLASSTPNSMAPPGLSVRQPIHGISNPSPPRFASRLQNNQQPRQPRVSTSSSATVRKPTREDSIRQTEPQPITPVGNDGSESDSSGSEGSDENISRGKMSKEDSIRMSFSPSTEANRMVAFSVAESALMGDDEDDGLDIDQRIRMLERRVTGEAHKKAPILSAIAHHTSLRSKTPPAADKPFPTSSHGLPAPIKSDLSASAPAFQFKPKVTLPWEEEAAKKAGMDVLSYQRQQMMASQGIIFKPTAMNVEKFEMAGSVGMERNNSHSRSRSEIPAMILNTPTVPLVPFGPIGARTEGLAEETIAPLPPPRSMTPLPFKRPSFAEAMLMPPALVVSSSTDGDKVVRRNGLPTLAEISARYMASRAQREESEREKDNASISSSSSDRNGRSKRYSVESSDSLTSNESSEQTSSGNDSECSIGSGHSLPTTPRKSRLPAFLQHRRTYSSSSTGSGDVYVYSPTKSVHFAEEQLKFPPQTPQIACPTLRVIPPSVESIAGPKASLLTARNKQNMQVMFEGKEESESKPIGLTLTPALPVITCTPATAPGIGISPLQVLEAEIQKQAQGEASANKRQERAQFMMSTLQRRRGLVQA